MKNSGLIKIAHISDTHGMHQFLDGHIPSDADILCHSGDFSNGWGNHDYKSFLDWFASQPQKHRVLISGNHELQVQADLATFRELCHDYGITYLHHEETIIEGIKFFGSPYTPSFGNWAFNVDRGELVDYWEEIPIDTDVLVTHGPPFGIGDRCGVANDRIVGDMGLLTRILYLRQFRANQVLIHQFGHIHEDWGEFSSPEAIGRFYRPMNATLMNEIYEPTNTDVLVSFINPANIKRNQDDFS